MDDHDKQEMERLDAAMMELGFDPTAIEIAVATEGKGLALRRKTITIVHGEYQHAIYASSAQRWAGDVLNAVVDGRLGAVKRLVP